MSRFKLAKVKPSTLVEIDGQRWGCVYFVPFGFPFLHSRVYLDDGISIHWNRITSIGENAIERNAAPNTQRAPTPEETAWYV